VSGGAGGSLLAGTAGGTAPPIEGIALPSSAYLPTAEFLSELQQVSHELDVGSEQVVTNFVLEAIQTW